MEYCITCGAAETQDCKNNDDCDWRGMSSEKLAKTQLRLTTTLTAPNGLLPAEGLAKSVCGGTLKMCDDCGRALQFPITKDFCEECA